MSGERETLLVCRSLGVGIDGATVCGGIDLSLREGEYLSVVGPRSAGKSLFISTLAGLLPPCAGSVEYAAGLKKSEIGVLPQTDDGAGNSTAAETVMAGCVGQLKGLFVGRSARRMAMEALERLDVAELADRPLRVLSGGQRQRVLLARALAGKKRLLLLDEPLRGLDAASRDELFRAITRVREEEGAAVVMADGEAVDGTVLHLSGGVQFYGPVEEYVRSLPGQLYFAGHIL